MSIEILTIGEVFAEFRGNAIQNNTFEPKFFFKGPYIGGKPAIFSKVISNFKRKIGLISCVGDDAWGNFIFEEIKKSNIDTSLFRKISDYNTPIEFITETEENKNNYLTIIKYTSATQIYSQEIDKKSLKNIKYLYISGSSLIYSKRVKETIYEIANLMKKSSKVIISLCNIEEIKTTIELINNSYSLLKTANIIFVDLDAIESFFENTNSLFKELLKNNTEIIILKKSNIPIKIFTKTNVYEVSSPNIKKSNLLYLDEVYNASFVCGLLKGFDENISSRFANTALFLYTLNEGKLPDENEIRDKLSGI